MKKKETAEMLNLIYKDILSIKIKPEDSFKSSMDKFYDIMRKYGICQGTKTENGVTINNAEWNMCFAVFKNHKILAFDVWLVLSTPPSDLKYYK